MFKHWWIFGHTYGPWEKDIAVYGNAFGQSHKQLVRHRECTICHHMQIKPIYH
jgi:hypothetical protein